MPDSFALPIDDVRPSQPYLNGRKLSLVAQWFDFDAPNYDPLPVRRFGGREEWTLTDGHTRAFVAHLSGADELRVARDDDLSVAAYEQCVEWCETAGVRSVADLAGRVVSPTTFETQWVERCRSLPE